MGVTICNCKYPNDQLPSSHTPFKMTPPKTQTPTQDLSPQFTRKFLQAQKIFLLII